MRLSRVSFGTETCGTETLAIFKLVTITSVVHWCQLLDDPLSLSPSLSLSSYR
jgi:hypothetical protein